MKWILKEKIFLEIAIKPLLITTFSDDLLYEYDYNAIYIPKYKQTIEKFIKEELTPPRNLSK